MENDECLKIKIWRHFIYDICKPLALSNAWICSIMFLKSMLLRVLRILKTITGWNLGFVNNIISKWSQKDKNRYGKLNDPLKLSIRVSYTSLVALSMFLM